ncbi:unnamed protein product [Caenorhabditis nigoni]
MRWSAKTSWIFRNGKSKRTYRWMKETRRKHEMKRRAKKRNVEGGLKLIGKSSQIFFLYLICFSNLADLAPVETPKYSLENAAHDFTVVSRAMNAMAIEEGLRDKSIGWTDLMNDFLGFGEEISLPVLRGEKWEEVGTLLNQLSESIREQCNDDKSCIKMNAVSSGIQALEEMDLSSFKDMDAVLKTFEPLLELKKFHDDTQSSISSMEQIIKKLESTPSHQLNQSISNDLFIHFFNELNSTETTMSKTWNSIEVLNDLESSFNSVVQYEKDINDVRSKTDTIETMKQELKKMGELRGTLLELLKDGKQETASRILKLLLQIGNSEEKKVLTSGLFNGTSDIKQIAKDLNDPFFVEVISDGNNVTILRDMLTGVFKMPTELESLETSDGLRRPLIKAGERIHQVENNLESAVTDLQKSAFFDKLLKCMETESFTLPPLSEDWQAEKARYETNKNEITNFVTNLKATPYPSDKLAKYQELQTIIAMQDDPNKDAELNSFDFNILKTELQECKKVLEDILLDKFKKWGKSTQIDETVNELRNSLNGTNFGSIIDCAKKDGVLEDSKNLSANSQLFSSLSKFSPQNEDLLGTQESISTIQKLIQIFLKLPKTQPKTVRHRKRSVSNSTQLFKLSKFFGGGVRILRDLVTSKKSWDAIKKITDSFNKIDAEIEKLDIQKAAEVKKHWTPEMKKFIKELSSQTLKVEESIQDRPKEISDFKNIFSSITKVDLANLNSLEVLQQFSFLKKPDDVREALDTFGSLNLDFSSAVTKIGASIASLAGIQTVFDDLFKINRNPAVNTSNPLDKTTTEPEQEIPWEIIGISVFACFALGGGVVGGYYLKKYYDKKRRYAKIRKEHEKEMEQLAKDNPVIAEIYRSQKGQKLKAKIQPKTTNSTSAPNIANAATDANAPKANSGAKPKTTAKKVTKSGKKAPAKEVLSNASGKDGPCLVVKKKMNKYQTKDIEQTTTEEYIADHKPKNEKDIQDALDMFSSSEARAAEFKTFHDGIDQAQLRREEVIKMDKNHNQKKPEDRKLYLAPNIDKNRLKEDNYYAIETTDLKDLSLPDRFTPEHVRGFQNQRPCRVRWRARKNKIDVRFVENFLCSSNDTREEFSVVQKFFQYIPRELVTLEETQDMSSRMSSRKSRRMSKAEMLQEMIDMQTARSSRRAPAGGEQLADLPLPPLVFSKNIHDTDHALQNFIAMTAHSYRSLQSGKDYEGEYPITPEMFNDVIKKAAIEFAKDPALVRIASERIYKVGDIHGNYMDFVRHIIIILCDPDATCVFLGDYVDRGNRSLDVLYLMCLVKILFPKKFFFLRGNHETPSINRAYGFLEECMTLYGTDNGKSLWKNVNVTLFSELPLCALFHDKVFLAHGGLSELFLEGRHVLDEITKRPVTIRQWKIWYDLLWSDPLYIFYPDNIDRPVFTKSPRCNYSTVFNQAALDKVLEVQGWILVVRAHEVVKHGFEFFHKQKLLTIFGACNNSENNKAVHSCLTADGILTIRRFQSLDGLEDEDEDVPTEDEEE